MAHNKMTNHEVHTISMSSKQQGVMRTPLGEFQIGKTLGEGSYGKVKLITNIKSNEKLAVKIVKRFVPPDPETGDKGRGGKSFEQRILREANLTRFLRHPYIVPLKDCRITKSHFYLFHEYIQGSQLTDKIGRNGLKLELAAHYFEQIIEGIGYCHANFVVHRDIKVENIMIDNDNNVKIIDFGLANFFDQKNALKTFCGSLQYSAPEIMRGDPYIGPEVDIWSIGVVLFAMLTGTLPFDDPRNPGAWECVMSGKIRFPNNMAQGPKSLITRLLDPNPKRRIGMTEIVKHPFFLNQSDHVTHPRPSQLRILPPQLDMSIIAEMTACMFQSEYTILQQLEGEMKKGKEQDGAIVVANSPLVAVYHLIANTRELVKPMEVKPRPRSTNLIDPPTTSLIPRKDPPSNESTQSKSKAPPKLKSLPSDELPLALPRREAVQPIERSVTDPSSTSGKLTHRTCSENGAVPKSSVTPERRRLNLRPRAKTISEPTPTPETTTPLARLNSEEPPHSEGQWDKETYKAKRASMYETCKAMNQTQQLTAHQKREQYLKKRASLYDGLYKGSGPDSDDTATSTSTSSTLKRRLTLFKGKGKEQLKVMNKEERQAMIKDRLHRRLSKTNFDKESEDHDSAYEEGEEQPPTHVLSSNDQSSIKESSSNHQPKVSSGERVEPISDATTPSLPDPSSSETSVTGSTRISPDETTPSSHPSDTLPPGPPTIRIPTSEGHPPTTELRSPFLTQPNHPGSHHPTKVVTNDTTPTKVTDFDTIPTKDPTNDTTMTKDTNQDPTIKEPTNDSQPKLSKVLPQVSHQRRYLDRILSSYRNKANGNPPPKVSEKLTSSQTTRVTERTRSALLGLDANRPATMNSRTKKKVTFLDDPIEVPSRAPITIPAKVTTVPETTVKGMTKDATSGEVTPNSQVPETTMGSMIPPVTTPSKVTSKPPPRTESIFSSSSPQEVNDFTDGKVRLFKSQTHRFGDIVDNIVKGEAQAALPTQVEARRVEVPPMTDVTSALCPRLPSSHPTPPPLPTSKSDFETVPGVPQVSITECLRSNVIKIAKATIATLSDQFLDTLDAHQLEYEWLETAFDFHILIPTSHLTTPSTTSPSTSHFTVQVELVHILRARSSAILLKACQPPSDHHPVDPHYPSLIKAYLQALL